MAGGDGLSEVQQTEHSLVYGGCNERVAPVWHL